MIENDKLCALCTDQHHPRSACQWNPPKPCREAGCLERHHPSLHGSSKAKVMVIKTTSDDPNQYGLLPMISYDFREMSQSTTVFFDEGSNVSLITKKLADELFLEGKLKLTTILKACD